ncbi:hypothetical protein ACIQ1D_19525 [Lysinibacillus xylanilyticus]|uniref:hypothetical protein n=1 Tax=Lysinibacillus xylanilyticus TaxID=582475 RepID=UPI00380CDF29
MSKTINQIKSEQLGISVSTATNRLKKSLMFQLVQQANRDVCFKCERKIESEKELSVEHKQAWLHSENPIELFYDLDNIAFSHLKCNVGDARQSSVIKGKYKYKGIDYDNSTRNKKKWRARLNYEGKLIHLGRFATDYEAGQAYDEGAIKYYGDRAVTNKSLGLL